MAVRIFRRSIDPAAYRPSTYVHPKRVVPRCKECGLRKRSPNHQCKRKPQRSA